MSLPLRLQLKLPLRLSPEMNCHPQKGVLYAVHNLSQNANYELTHCELESLNSAPHRYNENFSCRRLYGGGYNTNNDRRHDNDGN